MNILRVIGVLLIIAGAVGLAYGQFSYTEETHNADLGPIEFQVEDKETINVPTWAGLGAVGLGVILLVVPGRK
ncbi:drug/metabolite transporter (DMT)-like permease [Methylohalomonas lacus]|uniref:Drug/metabolite transporter (DMT)-like permease n=1 Tax=Methylohalomonas lacus TaxID=398773 RepID=A0AAE3HMW1_9GAMM|nr:hypothetical protein [Methylohalomonas lacus]MCS3904126.1 drug/metabolite transporter (DMT)-like permease [Methylohalomonas lacus]